MILAALAVASIITWSPQESAQIGIAMGQGVDTRLILLVPETGCHDGMKIFGGHYGDFDSAVNLLSHSRVCSQIRAR